MYITILKHNVKIKTNNKKNSEKLVFNIYYQLLLDIIYYYISKKICDRLLC